MKQQGPGLDDLKSSLSILYFCSGTGRSPHRGNMWDSCPAFVKLWLQP